MAARSDDLRRPDPADVTVVLTPMRRRHLRAVLRIEHQVHARPWSMGLFLGELAIPSGRVYLVARVNGAVVGYGGLMVVFDEAHVTNIAVDPASHRLGIGTRLLSALIRQSVAAGARHVTLEVRMSNTSAQALYRRFGFAPAGVRRNYYVDTNEDAMVMWAHDVDTDQYRRRLTEVDAAVLGATIGEGPGLDGLDPT